MRVRWEDQYLSRLYAKCAARASSRLAQLSTKTGNRETAVLALSKDKKKSDTQHLQSSLINMKLTRPVTTLPGSQQRLQDVANVTVKE